MGRPVEHEPLGGEGVEAAVVDRGADVVDRGAVLERELEEGETLRGVGRGRVVEAERLELGGFHHATRAASSASPRRSPEDQVGSSPGARSSTPAGASQRRAGRGPCQRTA